MARGRARARAGGGRSTGGGRGRSLVALLLLGFLLVTSGIIWRRSYGIAESRTLRALEARRDRLEAQKTRLENEIRDASSRTRLATVVERRLQMRVPSDSHVVILPRPAGAHGVR